MIIKQLHRLLKMVVMTLLNKEGPAGALGPQQGSAFSKLNQAC